MRYSEISDTDFIRLFEQNGAAGVRQITGQNERSVYARRVRLEKRLGYTITPQKDGATNEEYPGRILTTVNNGTIIVASDAHYWPGPPTLMHRALIQFCKELKPQEIIMNGDMTDFPRISRHPPPANWAHQPKVQEELEAVQDRLGEIEQAVGKAKKRWTFGNHDQRYSRFLAQQVPQYEGVHGTALKTHFPLWDPCWAVWINNGHDGVVVKHRFKGGDHAAFNNVIRSGRHMVTSHHHAAEVRLFTNYNGTYYGVDSGMIGEPNHPAFDYAESNPKNWRSAFVVLSFRSGHLLQPELVLKWDANHVQFRGEIIKIKS